MNPGRKRSRWRQEDGYALAVSAAFIATMMLVIGLMVDFGAIFLARARLGAAAEAAVLGAIKEQSIIYLPVPDLLDLQKALAPDKLSSWLPLNGWIVPLITLKNVEYFGGEPTSALVEIAQANVPAGAENFKLVTETYVPGMSLSPFHYIRIRATATLKPKLLGAVVSDFPVAAEACAIAWVPVEHWAHNWYEAAGKLHGVDLKFYRVINCGQTLDTFQGWWDLLDMASNLGEQFMLEGPNTQAPGAKGPTAKRKGPVSVPPRSSRPKPKGSARDTATAAKSEAGVSTWGEMLPDPAEWLETLAQREADCLSKRAAAEANFKTATEQYARNQEKWAKAEPEQRRTMPQPVPPDPPPPATVCNVTKPQP